MSVCSGLLSVGLYFPHRGLLDVRPLFSFSRKMRKGNGRLRKRKRVCEGMNEKKRNGERESGQADRRADKLG